VIARNLRRLIGCLHKIVVFIVIALLLLVPEFLHGWSDGGGYSCTGRRIDGGECYRHDHSRRL
jgi:hypothetical protein